MCCHVPGPQLETQNLQLPRSLPPARPHWGLRHDLILGVALVTHGAPELQHTHPWVSKWARSHDRLWLRQLSLQDLSIHVLQLYVSNRNGRKLKDKNRYYDCAVTWKFSQVWNKYCRAVTLRAQQKAPGYQQGFLMTVFWVSLFQDIPKGCAEFCSYQVTKLGQNSGHLQSGHLEIPNK